MRRIVFVDALKAIAIICVVAVHAISQVRVEEQSREALMFVFGAIAVPLFFLVDGLLFSGKWATRDDFDFQDYIRKSAHRLLVPWTTVTLLYGVCRLVLESLSVHRENVLLGNTLPGIA